MTVDPAVITAVQGATRAAVYGASTVIVGAAFFEIAVLRRASGLAPAEQSTIRRRARRIAYVAAGVLFLGYIARLYIQVVDSFLVFMPTVDMVRQLIFSTRAWGLGLLAQLALSLVVLGLLTYARRTQDPSPGAIAATAPLAALSVPLTGHAVSHAGTIAVAAQATHVLAVGGWLGTLSVLWLVCRALPSTDDLAAVIRAFSPVALVSAAVLAMAGVATYSLHVGALDQLLSTRYGLVLLMKIAVFLSAAGVGYVNWRHLTPRLTETGQRDRFSRAAALEIALAMVALLLTTVLTNLPQPGDE